MFMTLSLGVEGGGVYARQAPRGKSCGPPPMRSRMGGALPGLLHCAGVASASATASPSIAP